MIETFSPAKKLLAAVNVTTFELIENPVIAATPLQFAPQVEEGDTKLVTNWSAAFVTPWATG